MDRSCPGGSRPAAGPGLVLLLSIAVLLSSCGGAAGIASEEGTETARTAPKPIESASPETTGPAEASPQGTPAAPPPEAAEGMPEYEDFFAPSDEAPKQQATGAGSAGAIPNVKPFNFGQDPGGPKDKTLYLTVPKLGLADVPVSTRSRRRS